VTVNYITPDARGSAAMAPKSFLENILKFDLGLPKLSHHAWA
jgi:hypothetical protein